MSEYQYYEFQAVDRPLSAKEMGELREISSRARISSTNFVNDYSWGSFKGSEDAWLEKYFDAFLYLANWGSHTLKLGLRSRLLDPATAKEYCGGGSASVREKGGKIILSFSSEDDEGGDWVDGEGQLASIISVRAELARGDLRALYVGWLLRVQVGELDDDYFEPPVPPGLRALSASLASMAEFLRIDPDLLYVAAEASPAWADSGLSLEEVGGGWAPVAALLQRFLRERAARGAGPATTGRTVGELLRAAEAHAAKRRRAEAAKRAKETASRERAAAIAREKHLDSLVGREAKLWAEVDTLIGTKQPLNYDRAVKILVDLHDLADRGQDEDFRGRLAALLQSQARKPTLMDRLGKVGL